MSPWQNTPWTQNGGSEGDKLGCCGYAIERIQKISPQSLLTLHSQPHMELFLCQILCNLIFFVLLLALVYKTNSVKLWNYIIKKASEGHLQKLDLLSLRGETETSEAFFCKILTTPVRHWTGWAEPSCRNLSLMHECCSVWEPLCKTFTHPKMRFVVYIFLNIVDRNFSIGKLRTNETLI